MASRWKAFSPGSPQTLGLQKSNVIHVWLVAGQPCDSGQGIVMAPRLSVHVVPSCKDFNSGP